MLARRTLFRYSLGLLRLVRAGNLGIVLLAQYAVAFCLVFRRENLSAVLTDWGLLGLSLATVMVAAAGYIINDYYDVKIDVINRPTRVVIDRILRRREALGFHFVLNMLGFGFALLAGKLITLCVLVSAFFLWVYSNSLKRLPLAGNLMIAFLTGFSVMLPAIYFRQNLKLALVYACFAGFITIIREILKDMEDVRGDASHGCRTLPIVYGIAQTRQIVYLLMVSFGGLLVAVAWWAGTLPLLFAGVLCLLLLGLGLVLARTDTRAGFGQLSTWCKIIMLVGIGTMAIV